LGIYGAKELMLKAQIHKLLSGRSLSREEARAAMDAMLSGDASATQIASLLTALRLNGETIDELIGMLELMRERMNDVSGFAEVAVDLCGTGGDSSGTFNLSTAAALVAAAGGVTVAKHAGRAASSQSGSTDFAEALRLPVHTHPNLIRSALLEYRFAILFAWNHHQAAKHVAPIRRELGFRTVFNLLGPLANPARVKKQFVGVFSPNWLEPIADTLLKTGSSHVMVVHGEGGLDEFSAEGVTQIVEGTAAYRRAYTLTPTQIGVRPTSLAAAQGGTAEENAARFVRLAEGREPALAEWVIANAAPAFYLSGQALSMPDAADQARAVIDSGELSNFLRKLQASHP
jgi:anthranilate phosphoribosyltransferase